MESGSGNSALSLSYPVGKLAKILLETGRLDLDQDKDVFNLAKTESGTVQFNLKDWHIIMNSEKSVQSIINTYSLFPSDIKDVSLSETDIKEGDKFLAACKSGDTEHVQKCLDVNNTSVLNKIDT
jgi:hypothetical protein